MKTLTISCLLILGACYQSMGQSPTPAKVAIAASYVSITYTDVYPYQSGKTDKTAKIDSSVHFKMNKGTKFSIVSTKNSGGTTQGYVITPWKYNDGRDSAIKASFYKSVVEAKKQVLANQKKLLDNISKKQDSLKAVKAQLKNDSLKLESSKETLLQTQQATVKSASQLLDKVINIDVKKAIAPVRRKDTTVKQQVKQFTSAQAQIKAKLNAGVEPDSTLERQLIHSATALPLNKNVSLKRYADELTSQKIRLNYAQKSVIEAKKNYDDNKSGYKTGLQELLILTSKVRHSGQYESNKTDPFAYRITKEQINDRTDTIKDFSSSAALYDDLAYINSWANGWQFFISAEDFSNNCLFTYPHSNKFTWGFLTLPVKMRFDNNKGGRFDFEQNLNFGLTFGDKHQLVSTSDISLNYLVGLSVVNVPLNDATTTTPATSTTAISTSIGCMFQYDKFQIGAFVGEDFAGSHANQFNYQGKLWLGFAIGVSLFGEGKTTATAQKQKSN